MANASSRRWLRRFTAAGVLATGLGVTTDRIVGQTPLPQPQPPLQPQVQPKAQPPAPPVATAPVADKSQPVAYIYGNVPITHDEFGKYLMDRGGSDKLELFVNKRIIELAAAQAKVTVTKQEMEASLAEDIASLGSEVRREDFVKVVLAKHGKTFFEWMEDVVRPRLLLQKMCYTRVKVTEDDLKKQFERRYGEQRAVQIILWPKGDNIKVVSEQYEKIRADAVEFDSAARAQANPGLAAACGKIKPICKHLVADDKIVETTAYRLKVNEVSEVLQTQQGYLVMKLLAIIPPNAAANYEKEKPVLQKIAYDEMLEAEIPKYFAELRKAANVSLHYVPPAEWRALPPLPVPSIVNPGPAGVTPTSGTQPGR